jgi:hypothetical protein
LTEATLFLKTRKSFVKIKRLFYFKKTANFKQQKSDLLRPKTVCPDRDSNVESFLESGEIATWPGRQGKIKTGCVQTISS